MHQDAAMLKGFIVPKSPFGQTAFAASCQAAAPDSQRSTNWRCRSPAISPLPAHESGTASSMEANGEELHALVPNRIELGFRYSLPYSVSDLKILEDHGS
jgi:hypothetical protein